jgi:hypothetical protein
MKRVGLVILVGMALTQLYNTITAEALTPLLQKALSGVLPIDEPRMGEEGI